MTNLRKLAKDEPCIKCGVDNGTTVLAHYNGMYNHWFGNGMGTKSHDLAGMWLCSRCHTDYDQRKWPQETREETALLLCLRTAVKVYEKLTKDK